MMNQQTDKTPIEKDKPSEAALGSTSSKSNEKLSGEAERNAEYPPSADGTQAVTGPDNIGTSPTPLNPDMNH